jgi:hypothetical protein
MLLLPVLGQWHDEPVDHKDDEVEGSVVRLDAALLAPDSIEGVLLLLIVVVGEIGTVSIRGDGV